MALESGVKVPISGVKRLQGADLGEDPLSQTL
jgi:hypothetical protein